MSLQQPEKERKNESAESYQRRTASLATNYNRDSCDGGESQSRKRRKSESLKPSRAASSPTNSSENFWVNTKEHGVGHPIHHEQYGQQGSQMTTPPDSGKKEKKRKTENNAGPVVLRAVPKIGAFKKLTITKPLVTREKATEDSVSSSNVFSNRQGWTTTEDAVRQQPDICSATKTTLEKLAAFRFQPTSSGWKPPDLSTFETRPSGSGPQQTQHKSPQKMTRDREALWSDCHSRGESTASQGPTLITAQLPLELQAQDDLCGIPSDDFGTFEDQDLFQEIFSRGHITSDGVASEVTPRESRYKASEQDRRTVAKAPEPASETPPCRWAKSNFSNQSVDSHLQQPSYPPEHSAISTDALQQTPLYDDPTSSEIRELNDILDEFDRNREAKQLDTDEAENIALNQDSSCNLPAHIDDDNGVLHTFKSKVTANSSEFEATLGKSAQMQLNTMASHLAAVSRTILAESLVERSDTYELNPKCLSNDFETDEFDEDLEDADLLDVIPDFIFPETQGKSTSTQLAYTDELLKLSSLPFSVISDASESGSSPQGRHSGTARALDLASKTLSIPSPGLLGVEIHDAFGIDEDEENMLKVSELASDLMERSQVPTNVQCAFTNKTDPSVVHDRHLQFYSRQSTFPIPSPGKTTEPVHTSSYNTHALSRQGTYPEPLAASEEKGRRFIQSCECEEDTYILNVSKKLPEPQRRAGTVKIIEYSPQRTVLYPRKDSDRTKQHPGSEHGTDTLPQVINDSHDYRPLRPFARPHFPSLIRDRSPVIGFSTQTFLRTCFRIGEMYKEGARCNALGHDDAVIELFARIISSFRETGTTKQHFQFADLWHDRPPFPDGVLLNYKSTGLAESETRAFLGADGEGSMVRCFGRLKRRHKGDKKEGWLLYVISIRETGWEEVGWTKRIVSAAAGLVVKGSSGLEVEGRACRSCGIAEGEGGV